MLGICYEAGVDNCLKKGVYVGKALTSEQRGSFSENESKIFHLLVSSLCLTYSLDVENTSSLQYHIS